MKVLGIMGSPRVGGNTDLLLDACLKCAESLGAVPEKIHVDSLAIGPCRELYGCLKDGNCVIQDDMQDIYPKLLEADVVVVASPMFFYGLSGQLKSLIDRCQAMWSRRSVLNQPPPTLDGKERLLLLAQPWVVGCLTGLSLRSSTFLGRSVYNTLINCWFVESTPKGRSQSTQQHFQMPLN